MVEIFTGITRQAIRRGTFRSVKEPTARWAHHRRLQRPLPALQLD
jgi:hypothetical protein